jgi:putative transposon-encoded protein
MVIYMVKKRNIAEKPMEIKMTGYEVVEKRAKQCSTSARVLVPKAWIGKRVRAVRVDP